MHGRDRLRWKEIFRQRGRRFAIVVARWNAVITDRLLQGSLDALMRSGCGTVEAIEVVRVPGCVGDPLRGTNVGRVGALCSGDHAGRPAARRDGALRGYLQRGGTRESGSRSRKRGYLMRSGYLRARRWSRRWTGRASRLATRDFEAAVSGHRDGVASKASLPRCAC